MEKYRVTIVFGTTTYEALASRVEFNGNCLTIIEVAEIVDGSSHFHTAFKKVQFFNCSAKVDELGDEYYSNKEILKDLLD